MKKKYWITGTAVVIVLIAAVLLILINNNSEFRIQNSELNTEAVVTAVPASEETENTELIIHNSELSDEPDNTNTSSAEENKEETVKETAEAEATEQPFLVQITDDDPSIAYVLIRMPNPIGLLPLPLEGEYSRPIRTKLADGSEYVNVLHLTPDGFRMEDANCEGHDCVNQGEVTLKNREDRILFNMIICLPHQLSAELITREEAEQMLRK